MTAPSTDAPGSSLSELYIECIQSFAEFLVVLDEKDCRVICLEQVHLPEILEEYGRVKVWGDQTKAELPARARGSLDDTLRHDDKLRDLVQAILMRLKALLSQATCIARRKRDLVLGSDRDSISSVSADSESDLSEDGEHHHYRVPKIRLLVQQILGQIRSLYDLSALLRRPKIADKYISSINSRSHIATLNNPDHVPLSVAFGRLDETHVAEKVLQWRGLTRGVQGIDFEVENVAPMGQELTGYGVEDILWFCQRLAAANTRRREQFQYWADHPYDPSQETINAARLANPRLAQYHTKKVEEKHEPKNQAPTFQPSIPGFQQKGPRSAVSKQSFSTAPVSDIHDTKTNVRPRTVYAPTAVGQGRYNSVPNPPVKENKTTFSCPYCGTTLESSKMKDRQSWKRHVFRDLRPYICTFEECQNGGKLYVSRHDWIYHELQIHRRKYVCKVCQMTCFNRKEMSTHIREHYDESISPSQLGVILDLCNHQVDISDPEKDPCLVCGEELPLSALQKHLAAHMEDIALFVLPNTNEEEDCGDSKASVRGVNASSQDKTSDTESEASDPGYFASEEYRQIPTDFSKLLPSEEVGYSSKFMSWRTTDEDQASAPVEAMLETNKTVLGENHPETLTSMVKLAWIYVSQGRWKEAEQLQVQVIDKHKIILGPEHPNTLSTMADLVSIYINQSRWEEAQELSVQVIEMRKTIIGAEHPDTLSAMTDLALTYINQSRWAEAQELVIHVTDIRKTILGADHSETLLSMADLALTYRNQGQWEKAEQLQVQVLKKYQRKRDMDHSNPLTRRAFTWK